LKRRLSLVEKRDPILTELRFQSLVGVGLVVVWPIENDEFAEHGLRAGQRAVIPVGSGSKHDSPNRKVVLIETRAHRYHLGLRDQAEPTEEVVGEVVWCVEAGQGTKERDAAPVKVAASVGQN
jgi:hypothetical protein